MPFLGRKVNLSLGQPVASSADRTIPIRSRHVLPDAEILTREALQCASRNSAVAHRWESLAHVPASFAIVRVPVRVHPKWVDFSIAYFARPYRRVFETQLEQDWK